MRKAGAVALLVVLSLLAAAAAGAESSLTDPSGDASTAPDITAMTVANDASGNITFTITTNQPALAADAAVELVLDQDNNATTGDYANGVATIKVNKADLGGSSTFAFAAATVQLDQNDDVIASDLVPHSGVPVVYR